MTGPMTFNLADLWEAVADHVPERTALVCGERRVTYAELDDRATRLAHWFQQKGVGQGDFVGLQLLNGPEYVEAMLAAYKIRAVPVNVNYRYVADELRYLYDDAGLVGVVHHRAFAPRIADVRDGRWCLAVDDGSGEDLRSVEAERYEEALAASSAERDFGPRSGDDLYVIYTGGTTGMPKGVVWRSEDAFFACMSGGDITRSAGAITAPEQLVERVGGPIVYLPVAPLMHAAGTWTVMMWLFAGGRIVLLPGSLDPVELWRTVEREEVNAITVVGDPVLRPLLDAWDGLAGSVDASSLFTIGSGGAPMSTGVRSRAMAAFPQALVVDGYGSSEAGVQGATRFDEHTRGRMGSTFVPADAMVVDPDTLAPVAPGSGEVGRVARSGRVPLGYHNDPVKTAATFPTVDGRRWAVSGDLATVGDDGAITVLGRGSLCINTGGEKVYPDEVEGVLRASPQVYDVVVVGAPDERWGQRVVAVVQPQEGGGREPSAAELQDWARASLAGYKVPKDVVFVDQVVRSPSGKADYRWAAGVAAGAT